MSHIHSTELRMDSKEAIMHMCNLLPKQFTFHDQKKFKSYGRNPWDCDFCISVAGADYQVGFKVQDNGEIMPLVDFWDGSLKNAIGGTEMPVLMRSYNMAKVHLESSKLGYDVECREMPNNNFKLLVREKDKFKSALEKSGWTSVLKNKFKGAIQLVTGASS